MKKDIILVIGSSGQIGSDLIQALRADYGADNVIASDIRPATEEIANGGPFELLDATDKSAVYAVIKKYNVNQVYLLAALLSATAETNPQLGWDLNMNSISHILDIARENQLDQIFYPSSIAVFGSTTPKILTPQRTIMEPTTVYGITKQAGERWAEYYFRRYKVDIRSIRYPGLISYKADPGGGTTDYAVKIYHDALTTKHHECFLSADTVLPMMYMPDAIRATISLMQSDASKISIRSSYNLAGISFSPKEIAENIAQHVDGFKISYAPDFRQAIADSWPQSIDDSFAQNDWGWKPEFGLDEMTQDMLKNLAIRLKIGQ
jgi:nucleoside-diphosphate-sugar epimerase